MLKRQIELLNLSKAIIPISFYHLVLYGYSKSYMYQDMFICQWNISNEHTACW